jgi:hypothetical protein
MSSAALAAPRATLNSYDTPAARLADAGSRPRRWQAAWYARSRSSSPLSSDSSCVGV